CDPKRSKAIQSGPKRSRAIQSDPLWATLDRSGSLWIALDRFGSLWIALDRTPSHHGPLDTRRDQSRSLHRLSTFVFGRVQHTKSLPPSAARKEEATV